MPPSKVGLSELKRLYGLIQDKNDIKNILDPQFLLLDDLLQRPALDVFHDDEIALGACLDTMDGGHIGVAEGRGGLRLMDETQLGICILSLVGRQELKSDLALESGVLSLIDHPHATHTGLFDDPVVGNR